MVEYVELDARPKVSAWKEFSQTAKRGRLESSEVTEAVKHH